MSRWLPPITMILALAVPAGASAQATCAEVQRVVAQARASGFVSPELLMLQQRLCGGAVSPVSSGVSCEALTIMHHLAALSADAEPSWADDREVQGHLAELRRVKRLACDPGAWTPSQWINGFSIQVTPGDYLYPDGAKARRSERWYYPTGKRARTGLGQWFYPNGRRARTISGTWYDPAGHHFTPTRAQKQAACAGLGAAGCHDLGRDGRELALVALMWRRRR